MNDGKPDPVAKAMNDLIRKMRQGGKPDLQIERLLERLRKSLQAKKDESHDDKTDRDRA